MILQYSHVETTVIIFVPQYATDQTDQITIGVPPTRQEKRELDNVIKILRAASKGVKKTELRHRCRLPPAMLGKYLSALMELNLLEAKDMDETRYKTTEKGLELLHTYHKLKWLLWGGTFDFMLVGLLSRLKIDKKEREKYTAYIS